MNPQTAIELARSENRGQLSHRPVGNSAPAMRRASRTIRTRIGTAMVRWGNRLGAERPSAHSSSGRLAVSALH